jgi:hypothetical protein
MQHALALLDCRLPGLNVGSYRAAADCALLLRRPAGRYRPSGARRAKLLSTALYGPHRTGTHYPHPRVSGSGRLQLGHLRAGQGAAPIGADCLLLPLEWHWGGWRCGTRYDRPIHERRRRLPHTHARPAAEDAVAHRRDGRPRGLGTEAGELILRYAHRAP